MKTLAIVAVFMLTCFSGFACGSGNKSHTFQNKTAFESYIAGALGTDARDVHCTKTSGVTATCQTDLGTILIKCAWADKAGGHDCYYKQS